MTSLFACRRNTDGSHHGDGFDGYWYNLLFTRYPLLRLQRYSRWGYNADGNISFGSLRKVVLDQGGIDGCSYDYVQCNKDQQGTDSQDNGQRHVTSRHSRHASHGPSTWKVAVDSSHMCLHAISEHGHNPSDYLEHDVEPHGRIDGSSEGNVEIHMREGWSLWDLRRTDRAEL